MLTADGSSVTCRGETLRPGDVPGVQLMSERNDQISD